MYGGAIRLDETSVHPFYNNIQQNGGIWKIFMLFKRNVSERSKNSSAICIGIAFKAREITDNDMKLEIIQHLKTILKKDSG
ncbi:MAG: hypothetical protein EZS28_044317, partial [Streblomastix strix]